MLLTKQLTIFTFSVVVVVADAVVSATLHNTNTTQIILCVFFLVSVIITYVNDKNFGAIKNFCIFSVNNLSLFE